MTEPEPVPAAATPDPAAPQPALSTVAVVSALVVLVAFGGFVAFLVTQRNAEEIAWTRLAWLFVSVEAVAFGAAGALFGSTIQRRRAEQAEAAAARSAESAAANADAAARGQALAEAIKADEPAAAPGNRLEPMGPAGRDDTAARHAALARALFP